MCVYVCTCVHIKFSDIFTLSLMCEHSFNVLINELMAFYWSLRDSKSSLVSMTLLRILADLSNAKVGMVSAHTSIYNSSTLPEHYKALRIILSAPITICITVNFLIHSFFNYQAIFKSLTLFFVFFDFPSVARWSDKIHNSVGSLFFVTITRSGHQAGIRWSVCISKSWEFWTFYSPGEILDCACTIW